MPVVDPCQSGAVFIEGFTADGTLLVSLEAARCPPVAMAVVEVEVEVEARP